MKKFYFFGNIVLIICAAFSALATAQAEHNAGTDPSLDMGAKVFAERCMLCHGSSGMGEGLLPLKLKGYPNTNLLHPVKAKTRSEVNNVIIHGGKEGAYSHLMPPYGKELSWLEIESVTNFVLYLRASPSEAAKQVKSYKQERSPRAQLGKEVYSTRCVLCHGKYGEGDGRMSKLLKTPPPFDLTASRIDDKYLAKIINEGGEAMGRSKHMPPWKDQLSAEEIGAIIEYLKSIRD